MASNGYITTSTNTYLCVDVCSWLPMGMAISKNTCFPFLRGQHLCGNEELLVAVLVPQQLTDTAILNGLL